MTKYLRLISYLISNNADKSYLEQTIVNCYEKPKTYLESNERMLDEKNDILWFALIDALIEKQYAIELDWKSNVSDIEWGIKTLFEKQKINFDVFPEIENADDLDAGEILAIFNNTIKNEAKMCLVNLDIDSDSYVTILINEAKLENLTNFDVRIKKY
jgi:hypothetical protein